MARTYNATSLDDILLNAVRPVVERTAIAITKSIATVVAARIDAELRASAPAPRAARNGIRRSAARARTVINEWSADRRARRVPKFVIEATGLDTKKKIVAKYGENATFQKGKPLPRPK